MSKKRETASGISRLHAFSIRLPATEFKGLHVVDKRAEVGRVRRWRFEKKISLFDPDVFPQVVYADVRRVDGAHIIRRNARRR
jgi:hypothetical protein